MLKVRPALIPGSNTSLLASPLNLARNLPIPMTYPSSVRGPSPLPPSRTGTKLLRVVEFIFLAAFLFVGCLIFVRQEAPVTGSLLAWLLFKMLFAPFSTILFNIAALYRSELANWFHRVQQQLQLQQQLRRGYAPVRGGT